MNTWIVPERPKVKTMPPWLRVAFLDGSGKPYVSRRQIDEGCWQPVLACINGEMSQLEWREWDATWTPISAGSRITLTDDCKLVTQTGGE